MCIFVYSRKSRSFSKTVLRTPPLAILPELTISDFSTSNIAMVYLNGKN